MWLSATFLENYEKPVWCSLNDRPVDTNIYWYNEETPNISTHYRIGYFVKNRTLFPTITYDLFDHLDTNHFACEDPSVPAQ
jgi:hypothetical protein